MQSCAWISTMNQSHTRHSLWTELIKKYLNQYAFLFKDSSEKKANTCGNLFKFYTVNFTSNAYRHNNPCLALVDLESKLCVYYPRYPR